MTPAFRRVNVFVGSLTVLLALGSAAVAGPHAAHGTIAASQFAIGGVSIGDREAQVRRALGRPREIERGSTEVDPGSYARYRFDGLEVYFLGDEVMNVRCTSAKYRTPDGARVGQTPARIQSTYGRATVVQRGGGEWLRYDVRGSDAALFFKFRRGRVVEIELWFDYT